MQWGQNILHMQVSKDELILSGLVSFSLDDSRVWGNGVCAIIFPSRHAGDYLMSLIRFPDD